MPNSPSDIPVFDYDVSIIIVTYNSEDNIRGCIRSVLVGAKQMRQQIIVLDNTSTDSTVEILKQEFPEVLLLLPPKNLGFAAGVNEAARHASSKCILLLNPDATILDDAIDEVVRFTLLQPQAGLVGGRALKQDGSVDPSSCWGNITIWSLLMFATGVSSVFKGSSIFDPESLGGWERDSVQEVGLITGCFLAVRRDVWEKVGGFDERYFMYAEDADLAIRVRKLGYTVQINPAAKFQHEGGQSSSTASAKMVLLFRGKVTLLKSHWNAVAARLGIALLLSGVALRASISYRPAWFPWQRAVSASHWLITWQNRRQWIEGYDLGKSI